MPRRGAGSERSSARSEIVRRRDLAEIECRQYEQQQHHGGTPQAPLAPRVDHEALGAEGTATQQAITFHVEAMLMIDPAPERISFDTVLEVTKGAYSVKDS